MRTWLDVVTPLAAIVFAAFSGCSVQPDRPADTATAAPPSATPAAAPGSDPAPQATSPPPTVKVPAGYRRVTRRGQEYFCRSETIVGTKLPETYCFTREQLREIEERADSVMDAVGRGCAGGGCGAQ